MTGGSTTAGFRSSSRRRPPTWTVYATLLLARPYRLSHEAADFCLDAGLGFIHLDR